MPFSDEHLKAPKWKIVALTVGIMVVANLLMVAVFTVFRQNFHTSERDSLWIFAAFFLLAWIVGTVLYVFSFRPDIQVKPSYPFDMMDLTVLLEKCHGKRVGGLPEKRSGEAADPDSGKESGKLAI